MNNRGRGETVRRLLKLMRYVDGMRYATLDGLAAHFNVTDRQMRRDLEMLEEVGCRVPKWRQNGELAQ